MGAAAREPTTTSRFGEEAYEKIKKNMIRLQKVW
jgi:hypothetical protein